MSANTTSATYTLRTSPNPNLKSHGTLYSFPSSIAATMCRFTLSVIPFPFSEEGEAKAGGQEFEIDTKEVNIHGPSEQLTEQYLCDINPNGSVPTLVIDNDSGSPFTSNVAIVERLVELFPTLAPEPHKKAIVNLVHELHAHKLFAISNGTDRGKERLAVQHTNLQNLLQDPNISDRHRSALEKKQQANDDKEASCMPDSVTKQQQSIRRYVDKIDALLEQNAKNSSRPTIFGTEYLTALDAQVAPLLVRLQMKGKDEYLGGENSAVRKFLQHIRSLDEWKKAAKGFHQEG